MVFSSFSSFSTQMFSPVFQIQGPGPWQCHGGLCQDNATCASTCGKPTPSPSPPTPPTNQTMYVCDKFSGQCVNASNTTAGATTKYECEHECRAAAPTGTYRGVQISSGFTRGEYDYTFYDDSSVSTTTSYFSLFYLSKSPYIFSLLTY